MNLTTIEKRIEALKRQAEVARAAEMRPVLAFVREAAKVYGFTHDDIFQTEERDGRKRHANGHKGKPVKLSRAFKRNLNDLERSVGIAKPAKRVKVKGRVMYRHGDDMWSGFGRPPQWLKTLEAMGHAREEFLV